jgi:hypothetical protein
MQDDATWKQGKVMVEPGADRAGRDAEMKERYGL